MMAMVVVTGVIFFSTMIYFLEKDEPGSPFNSIPAACWFSIVTMTTVGMSFGIAWQGGNGLPNNISLFHVCI